jgi:hypothetical protein
MNELNRFALYNFRARLPAWLERRAQRAARAGNIQNALRLCDLMHRAENRLMQTSPLAVESFLG